VIGMIAEREGVLALLKVRRLECRSPLSAGQRIGSCAWMIVRVKKMSSNVCIML